MSEDKFGRLRLSVEGTTNGRGFDILYDFGKSHNFVEFHSKKEFYFIQPWMQFPSDEYTDMCKLVSIEVVKRFNDYPAVKKKGEGSFIAGMLAAAKIAEEIEVDRFGKLEKHQAADAIRNALRRKL